MVAVYNLLGCDTLLAGAQGDGHTVLVAAPDHHHIFAFEAQIAGVDVGRYVYSGEVAYMNGAVGVRKRCCYERAFEFLFH